MTTTPVPTITDEQIAEIVMAAEAATGGEWEYRLGLIRTLPDSDGYVPVAVAPNSPKNWRGQRDRNMQYIAMAMPSAMLSLITRLRAAEKDSARLDKLDGIVEAYGFEVHEGNRWVIDGPFRDIRTAIDAMTEAKP